MTRSDANRSSLVRVTDSLGGHWPRGSADQRSQLGLVTGSKLALTVEASEGAMFALGVGGGSVATTEWNDSGCFELVVTSSYVPSLCLHIAVRHPLSNGTQSSEWLGPVDDLWVIEYEVSEAASHGGITDCP
jgi:hypothetical protein